MKGFLSAWMPAVILGLGAGGTVVGQNPPPVRLDYIVAVRSIDLISGNRDTLRRPSVATKLDNISGKTIYAFRLALTARYRDGSVQVTHGSVDLFPVYVNAAGLPQEMLGRLGLFRNGETYERAWVIRTARDGAAPDLVEGTVDAVIFENRTAIGDAGAIKEMLQLRALEAQVETGLVGDLEAVGSAADAMKALDSRLTWLHKVQFDARGQEPVNSTRRPPSTIAAVRSPNGKVLASKDGTAERAQKLGTLVRSAAGDRARIRAITEEQRQLAKAFELHSTLAEAQR